MTAQAGIGGTECAGGEVVQYSGTSIDMSSYRRISRCILWGGILPVRLLPGLFTHIENVSELLVSCCLLALLLLLESRWLHEAPPALSLDVTIHLTNRQRYMPRVACSEKVPFAYSPPRLSASCAIAL